MTKTPNYDLNQWDPEDKVIRTDFNEDNAKIDAALAGLEGARRSDLLGVYKFPAGGTALDISLSKFDLSKYISLDVQVSKFSGNTLFYVYFTLNGLQKCYCNQVNNAPLTYGGTITSDRNGKPYTVGGEISIRLDSYALGGEYTSITNTFPDDYVLTKFYRYDWAALPSYVNAGNLSTINLHTNNTPVTNGGTVFLIGNRF